MEICGSRDGDGGSCTHRVRKELQDKIIISMRDHVIDGWIAERLTFQFSPLYLVSLLLDHGSLWIDIGRRYVASLASATRVSSHLHAQFACGHRQLGKPPDCQTSFMTQPFEETAHFLCPNAHQRPIPLFAK